MNNKQVINNFFKNFGKQIVEESGKTVDETIESTLVEWCYQIRDLAVRFRETTQKGHNFTGNLINSIVVILYIKGKGKMSFYGSDATKKPISNEMSATTVRGTQRKKMYAFHPDWSQRDSTYMPKIPTDRSRGDEDARIFSETYQPTLKTKYTIVVAYTSEYAEWVEEQNKTTGYLYMLKSTGKAAVDYIGLKKADNFA